MVVCKYGAQSGDLYSDIFKDPYSVGLWKTICNWWSNFVPFTRLEVGDDTWVLFWEDR